MVISQNCSLIHNIIHIKYLESSPAHLTLAFCVVYMMNSSLTIIKGRPLSMSFLNRMECCTMSNALVISIKQVNISDPFLRKYPTVSSTIQLHIEVEHCDWYPNWSSSRPSVTPNRIITIQSITFKIRLHMHRRPHCIFYALVTSSLFSILLFVDTF